MARLTVVNVPSLGGGVNDRFDATDIRSNESPNDLRNVRVAGNSKKPRKGYTTFLDEVSSGSQIQGITGYFRNTSANDRLVMAYNKKLYVSVPGTDSTWTAVNTTQSVDAAVNFANWRDDLFIFNGTDEPGQLNGTTYSEPFTKPDSVSGATAFTPSFGDIYNNSLVVGGVSEAPNVFYLSKPGSSASPADIKDFSGGINSGAADEILSPSRGTAFRSVGGIGVLFTENEAAAINGFNEFGSDIIPNIINIEGADGAINQQSTIVVENDILFFTPKFEIKSVKRNFAESTFATITPLSDKIKNFLEDNLDSDQSDCFAYYNRSEKIYKLYLRSDGATNLDICVVGDLRNLDSQTGFPTWTIYDAQIFSCGTFYKNQGYLGSEVIGQAYKDEDGLADDDDAPIGTTWKTKQFIANNPTTIKRYNNVVIYGKITTATSIDVTILVDGIEASSDTIDSSDVDEDDEAGIAIFEVGDQAVADDEVGLSLLQRFTKRIYFRKSGKDIQIKFQTNNQNQNYEIDYIDYSFVPITKLYAPISEKA